MPDEDLIARHLLRLRAGAYSRDVKIHTPDGVLIIDARDAAPINGAIEAVLARLVKRERQLRERPSTAA